MARARATAADLAMIVARKAVEIHQDMIRRYCQELPEWSRRRYDYCRDPSSVTIFNKKDFVRAYYALRRENGIRVKWETLFRALRKLAEFGDGVIYVDRRKGIYKLIS